MYFPLIFRSGPWLLICVNSHQVRTVNFTTTVVEEPWPPATIFQKYAPRWFTKESKGINGQIWNLSVSTIENSSIFSTNDAKSLTQATPCGVDPFCFGNFFFYGCKKNPATQPAPRSKIVWMLKKPWKSWRSNFWFARELGVPPPCHGRKLDLSPSLKTEPKKEAYKALERVFFGGGKCGGGVNVEKAYVLFFLGGNEMQGMTLDAICLPRNLARMIQFA